jgi:hypothetical protein
MTDQPIEKPQDCRPILGLSHTRHACGTKPEAALCGYIPEDTPTHHATFTQIKPEAQDRYQDCIVCEELWENARALELMCGRCGGRIRP